MIEIRFNKETDRKKASRLILLNGPVVFTGRRSFKVPEYIGELLDGENVSYDILVLRAESIYRVLFNPPVKSPLGNAKKLAALPNQEKP